MHIITINFLLLAPTPTIATFTCPFFLRGNHCYPYLVYDSRDITQILNFLFCPRVEI